MMISEVRKMTKAQLANILYMYDYSEFAYQGA